MSHVSFSAIKQWTKCPFAHKLLYIDKVRESVNKKEYIEKGLNRKAKIKYLPKQLGDVRATLSSTKELKRIINYAPKISAKEGVKKFIEWYKSFYIK